MYSIYLDEFCWITLRDIASNKAAVKQLRPLLELCREKTSVSEWIFPLSIWHLIETQNTYNDENRMLLGEIQAALSRGWRLTTFPQIKAIELKAYMKDKSHCVDMSEIISRNPVLSDIEIEDIISENKKEAINCLKQIYCLVGGSSWSFTKQSECYVPFAETKERQLEYVQYLSEQQRLHGYSFLQFCMESIPHYFNKAEQLAFLSKAYTEIKELSQNEARRKLLNEIKQLPSFYVAMILLWELILQKPAEKLQKNDFTDIVFLSSAIPYCDIVITESQWISYAQKHNLEAIYNTAMYSNLQNLSQIK